ncbi:hypothetical protein GCM10023324_60580 [Streptomyces youssoufiensis]
MFGTRPRRGQFPPGPARGPAGGHRRGPSPAAALAGGIALALALTAAPAPTREAGPRPAASQPMRSPAGTPSALPNAGQAHPAGPTAAPARRAGPAAAPAVGEGARATGRAGRPVPLERLFDTVGTSDDADPAAADLDGAGNSLSARDLAAAGWTPGRALTLDATRLQWPRSAPGRPDNVRANGQHVALSGTGDTLTFLVTGSSPGRVGPGAGGTGTVHYRDGSRSTYTLTAPDWRGGPLATKAVALPHHNTPSGQRRETARLYAVSVPLARGGTVASLTLPADPGPDADLHVFALAVRPPATGWSGTWAASTSGLPPVAGGGGGGTGEGWRDQTLRLVVRASVGGPRARIRLANTFAAAPADIAHASVAVRGADAAAAADPVPLTFDGRPGTRIPAGAQAVSDPVGLTVPRGADLLVSLHLPGPVNAAPVHAHAAQRSYLSPAGSGDHTGDRDGHAFTGTLTTWPYLTGVDVAGGPGAVVALGDSITDGERSTPGANRRWPDVLARRLLSRPHGPRYGVLNQGIAANRVVTDRYPGDGVSGDVGGVSAQHRLERDVLAQTGVRTVIVFEGVNDVRSGTSADAVIAGLRAIADRARGRGLRVLAATIAPCAGFPGCTPEVDARRAAVNAFIREQRGTFDAVVDFDAVLRDPDQPERLLPAYDSGDHLHPGDAGLRALGDSVDLRLLTP